MTGHHWLLDLSQLWVEGTSCQNAQETPEPLEKGKGFRMTPEVLLGKSSMESNAVK